MVSVSVDDKQYVLGTGGDELERLAIQHRIWADQALASWRHAGIGLGARVLDLGCGPGYASFDLAQLLGNTGSVVGVDQSHSFIQSVNAKAKLMSTNVSASFADAENLQATLGEGESFDFAYTRWLLCWLKNPEKAIAGVYNLLKPGGRFVIHDYFNWKSMALAPRSAVIEKMVLAAVETFDESGGDIDIAARIPQLLEDVGFKLIHFDVHQRAARGGGEDGTVHWILSWWRSYAPKLVEMGKLNHQELKEITQRLDDMEKDKNQFFFCPPVFEFIAEK